jgi:uncharacterized protein (DUF1778 family)
MAATVQKKTKRAPYATESADRRTERLQIRLKAEEKDLLERAAEKEADLDFSNWSRRVLVREARRVLGIEE